MDPCLKSKTLQRHRRRSGEGHAYVVAEAVTLAASYNQCQDIQAPPHWLATSDLEKEARANSSDGVERPAG